MSEDHARLSPSNQRWSNCPGSVREEANYPDIPGEAAIDGTGSHILLESCIKEGKEAIEYDQKIIGANHPDNIAGWMVATDRIKRVQMCLDYIKRRVSELNVIYDNSNIIVESETKSNPGVRFGRDDWWGTADITITVTGQDNGEVLFIEVIDYKDGRGWVTVENNTQLISYLGGKIGLYREGNVKDCRMTIVQPKTNPVIRYQCSTSSNLSVKQVLSELDKLNKAALATDDPDAPLISGKHCRWCKANPKRGGHCMVSTNKSIETFKESGINLQSFQSITQSVSDVKSMDSKQLIELMDAKDALMAVFDNCEQEIRDRIEQGIQVDGYAMMPGRSSRKWNDDEETIVKKLKSRRLKQSDIYPPKLVTVAQLMKSDKLTDQQKKTIESELVTTISGKMQLKKVAYKDPQPQLFNDVKPISFF